MRDLGEDGLAGRLHANVALQPVDLDQPTAPELMEAWQQLGAKTLPWLLVRHPGAAGAIVRAWSGPLVDASPRQLFDSPARQEIIRRLTNGETTVWVLLESGDPARDAAAAQVVGQRLAYLTSVLKLPQLDPQDIAAGLVSVPAGGLKVAFSVVRVSRANPAEAVFVNMLLGTEPDLVGLKEPMLFPIFGRGRALYALAGAGINHETIDEAASFLTGRCSCQVKELNPGVDLLLAADWDSLVKTSPDAERDRPALLAAVAGAAPVTVLISGDNPSALQAKSSLPGVFALLTFFIAGFAWVWRR